MNGNKVRGRQKPTLPPAQAGGKSTYHKHAEAYTKATVVLFDRQQRFLDQLALDLGRKRVPGEAPDAPAKKLGAWSRSDIIRCLVDAFEQSGVDVTGARSEAELTETLLRRLRRK